MQKLYPLLSNVTISVSPSTSLGHLFEKPQTIENKAFDAS